MKDTSGQELKVGDKVVLTATVISDNGGAGFQNVTIESDLARKPDGKKEQINLNSETLIKVMKVAPPTETIPEVTVPVPEVKQEEKKKDKTILDSVKDEISNIKKKL